MERENGYWQLIEKYLPDYYTSDQVLRSDILWRYVDGEEVSDDDIEWIEAEFANNREIYMEIARVESELFKEAMENYCMKCAKSKELESAIQHLHSPNETNSDYNNFDWYRDNVKLLNASGATNFIYRLDGFDSEEKMEEINAIKTSRLLQDRVEAINRTEATPRFIDVSNNVFHNNLVMIDSCLPRLLADILWESYSNREMDIVKATERATQKNILNYDLSTGHDFYAYKLKSLMVSSALGMLPAKKWAGRYEATGGYIVVKDDGDIVCFHIYDRNLLEYYLFHNTKFETPSSRWDFGYIYKSDDGAFYFSLNLQIRFKK